MRVQCMTLAAAAVSAWALCLTTPPSANADVYSAIEGGQLRLTTAGSQLNAVRVGVSSFGYEIANNVSRSVAGTGCTQATARLVNCLGFVLSIQATGGNETDVFD